MGTETRIDEMINRWEEMRERATPLTIEELCCHCPELVAEVEFVEWTPEGHLRHARFVG